MLGSSNAIMVVASSCFLCELGGVGLHPASEVGDDNRARAKSGTISGSRQELIPTGFTLSLPLGGGWCWTNIADSVDGSGRQVGWPGGLGRALVSTCIHVTDFFAGLSSRPAPQSLLCEAEDSVRHGCVMHVSRGTLAALLLPVPLICRVSPCSAHCLGAADSRSIMSGNESLTRYPGVAWRGVAQQFWWKLHAIRSCL